LPQTNGHLFECISPPPLLWFISSRPWLCAVFAANANLPII
jgi:hypothetical protein